MTWTQRSSLTWQCVEVEQDPDAVFPGPRDGLEEVLPRDAFEVRLVLVRLDRPEPDGYSNCQLLGRPSSRARWRFSSPDPVQAVLRDEGKVLFGLACQLEQSNAELLIEPAVKSLTMNVL